MRETPALAAPVVKQKKAKKVDAAVTTVKVKGKKAAAVKAVAAATPVADTAKTPAKRRVAKKAAQLPVTTPVKVAPVKTAAKKVTAPKAKAKAMKSRTASTLVQAQELKGNSAKLMMQLQGILNEADFTNINQSAAAKAAGIPVGSIGATIARLVKAGRIVMGVNGSLKLAVAAVAATSAFKAEAQPDATVSAESATQA